MVFYRLAYADGAVKVYIRLFPVGSLYIVHNVKLDYRCGFPWGGLSEPRLAGLGVIELLSCWLPGFTDLNPHTVVRVPHRLGFVAPS